MVSSTPPAVNVWICHMQRFWENVVSSDHPMTITIHKAFTESYWQFPWLCSVFPWWCVFPKMFMFVGCGFDCYNQSGVLLELIKPNTEHYWCRWCLYMGQVTNCGCLVTWFCYQLIAKPGNKTATVLWPDPYGLHHHLCVCRCSGTCCGPFTHTLSVSNSSIFSDDVYIHINFHKQTHLCMYRW